MADMETGEYHAADAGSADCVPMQVSSVKKGGYCVLGEKPCKIVDMTTSKTGKHGAAKAHITGVCIFTGKKVEENHPTTSNIPVPNIKRVEYSLIDIQDDGYVSLLGIDSGETKDDVRLPEGELGDKIKEMFNDGKDVTVTVISAMGTEAICQHKEGKDN
jgi:translation initiation factor 5A